VILSFKHIFTIQFRRLGCEPSVQIKCVPSLYCLDSSGQLKYGGLVIGGIDFEERLVAVQLKGKGKITFISGTDFINFVLK
jgi:hypothetical protein